jgi:hypothetical protein
VKSSSKPKGYSGTVNKQFEGDQKGNRQVEEGMEGGKLGTDYHSEKGNSANFRRVVSHGLYGDSRGLSGLDQQKSSSNGNGVILDGMSRADGYTPKSERTTDSPVPEGAPEFRTSFIREENIARQGQGIGASPSQASDDILEIGGVMSRGLERERGEK